MEKKLEATIVIGFGEHPGLYPLFIRIAKALEFQVLSLSLSLSPSLPIPKP